MATDRPQSVALMLIDLQRDFLREDGRLPVAVDQVAPLIATVSALAEAARAAKYPLVHVVNAFARRSWLNLFRKFAAIEGSDGADIDERCPGPLGEEPVFRKSVSDAFSHPDLAPWLRDRGVERLVLCGVFANGCVRRTADGALKAGFAVQVVPEGVAAGSERARRAGVRAIGRAGGQVVKAADLF